MAKQPTEKPPRFVVRAPNTKAPKLGVLAIRRVSLDGLEGEIEKTLELAIKSGLKPTHVKGSLNLY